MAERMLSTCCAEAADRFLSRSLFNDSGEPLIVLIGGATGAGKSTVLNAISCVIQSRKGQIFFSDKPLVDLKPEVIVVTGDHSTPAILRGHSWHPVPFMLYSQYCRTDDIVEFSERACNRGALGRFPALDVMPLALANALKLTKFGA